MAKDCLYCGLQFADTTQFCPNCGRPTESGFIVRPLRPLQESEVDRLHKELKEKDERIRQLVLILARLGEIPQTTCLNDRRFSPDYRGIRASVTAQSSSRS